MFVLMESTSVTSRSRLVPPSERGSSPLCLSSLCCGVHAAPLLLDRLSPLASSSAFTNLPTLFHQAPGVGAVVHGSRGPLHSPPRFTIAWRVSAWDENPGVSFNLGQFLPRSISEAATSSIWRLSTNFHYHRWDPVEETYLSASGGCDPTGKITKDRRRKPLVRVSFQNLESVRGCPDINPWCLRIATIIPILSFAF